MTETALQVFRRSALEDSDCLYRFNEVHLKGVDDSSDYALRGQAFAHIKYLYIQRLLERKLVADSDEAQAAFIQGIAEHQTPNRLIPELRELWMRHAEVFTLDLERYVTSEERMLGDGVSFSPDLVYANQAELEIRDDKTYWVMLTEDEVKATYQARFYSWQARLRWPNFPTYRITFVFVRFNKTTSVVYTQAEIDQIGLEVQADVMRVRQAIAIGSFPANIGPACRYCELRCPLADRTITVPARLNAQQAIDVARHLIPAEKMMKSIKKALKGFSTIHGPVDAGGGQVWANRAMVQRRYPVDKVVQVLASRSVAGAFESNDLTVSHSALSSLFKRFPMLLEDLKPYAQTKTTFRFGLGADPNEAPDVEE